MIHSQVYFKYQVHVGSEKGQGGPVQRNSFFPGSKTLRQVADKVALLVEAATGRPWSVSYPYVLRQKYTCSKLDGIKCLCSNRGDNREFKKQKNYDFNMI